MAIPFLPPSCIIPRFSLRSNRKKAADRTPDEFHANMFSGSLSFNRLLLSHWDKFTEKVQSEVKPTKINGHELDLATIVAVARWLSIAFDIFISRV